MLVERSLRSYFLSTRKKIIKISVKNKWACFSSPSQAAGGVTKSGFQFCAAFTSELSSDGAMGQMDRVDGWTGCLQPIRTVQLQLRHQPADRAGHQSHGHACSCSSATPFCCTEDKKKGNRSRAADVKPTVSFPLLLLLSAIVPAPQLPSTMGPSTATAPEDYPSRGFLL